jgi:hypothetical protein
VAIAYTLSLTMGSLALPTYPDDLQGLYSNCSMTRFSFASFH